MFRFGKQVESALIALKAINESPQKGLSISEICSQHELSKNTMAKVMQALHAKQILKSSQGSKGGYTLSAPLSSLSFYQILVALGEIKGLQCGASPTGCDLHKTCSISSPLLKWEKKFRDYLRETSLDELLYEKPSSPLKEVHI